MSTNLTSPAHSPHAEPAYCPQPVPPAEQQRRRDRLQKAFDKLRPFYSCSESEVHVAVQFAVAFLSQMDVQGEGLVPQRFFPLLYPNGKRPGGRPPNVRAETVSWVVCYTYQRLTQRRLTVTVPVDSKNERKNDNRRGGDYDLTGDLAELVREVFDVLRIRQSVEHYVRHCCKLEKGRLKSWPIKNCRGKVRQREISPLVKPRAYGKNW